MNPHWLVGIVVIAALTGCAQTPTSTSTSIRICDASGCSDRPRDSVTLDLGQDDKPEETRRLALLADSARQDPRAAFDLGLRYFRGDGVRRDSYQALRWMREAGDRGHAEAQLALGRFYLMGLEEMGSDPAEAEKWLLLSAASGNSEASKLLSEASAAKKTQQELYRWRETYRKTWLGWWATGYRYYAYWGPTGWYYR